MAIARHRGGDAVAQSRRARLVTGPARDLRDRFLNHRADRNSVRALLNSCGGREYDGIDLRRQSVIVELDDRWSSRAGIMLLIAALAIVIGLVFDWFS
jgi:hypothetical protein